MMSTVISNMNQVCKLTHPLCNPLGKPVKIDWMLRIGQRLVAILNGLSLAKQHS